jgi:hypothetical protein
MLLVGVPSTLIFALRKRHGVTSKHGYADTVLPTVRLLSDKKWLASMFQLVGLSVGIGKGSTPKLLSVQPAPYGARAQFTGLVGQELRQWQVAAGRLASALRVPSVVVNEPVPMVFELELRAIDPIEKPVAFGAVVPAADWSLSLGLDEMGAFRHLPIANVSGVIVGGLPGSGKSAWLTSALGAFGPSEAAQFVIIDGKGGLDLSCLEPRSCRFLNDDLDLPAVLDVLAGVRDLVRDLVRDRIQNAHALFGSSNFWHQGPTARVPLLFVVIDECQTFLDSRQLITKEAKAIGAQIHSAVNYLVKKGRAAGVVTILATQKPTSDSLPTDIRDNASLRVCFGVQSTYAACAVLGDDWSAASSVSPLGAPVGIGVAAVDGKFVRFRAPYIPEATIARQMNDCAVLCLDPWQLLDAQLTRTA